LSLLASSPSLSPRTRAFRCRTRRFTSLKERACSWRRGRATTVGRHRSEVRAGSRKVSALLWRAWKRQQRQGFPLHRQTPSLTQLPPCVYLSSHYTKAIRGGLHNILPSTTFVAYATQN
ncbi:hypothetical protein FOMPIDRAFT_1063516, partial [Fomitopsis schrenkii]